MSDISRDEFFALLEGPSDKVSYILPNGKTVWVDEITPEGYEQFLMESAKNTPKDREPHEWDEFAKMRFLVRCVVDSNGKPIFSAADAERLGSKGRLSILEPLVRLAQRVNGLDPEARAEAKKNLEIAVNSKPLSVSPGTLAG